MKCGKFFGRSLWCSARHQSNIASCSKDIPGTDGFSNLVTMVNSITGKRTIAKMKFSNVKSYKMPTLLSLPSEAIEGLKNALITCSYSPKQLQHEADQLNAKLEQRKFPASHCAIQEARLQAIEKLEATNPTNDEERFDDKMNRAREYTIRREAGKYLRQALYNWKPLKFDTRESVAAYFLARLHGNYAEALRVFHELRRVNFTPKTVLDYGSGSCGVFWAANELWGSNVEEYQLVDPCDEMNKFAMDVMRGSDKNEKNAFVHPNVNFRRFLLPSPSRQYDLVVAHRVFIELASHESRLDLLSSLWARTKRFLMIIDSGTEGAFDALLSLRDFIIEAGYEIHASELTELLSSHGILSEEIETILYDKTLTNIERYYLLREKIPSEVELPTRVQPGFTFAPCPHDQGCPKAALERRTCDFFLKWKDLRADGKPLKSNDGTASGTFSYFILAKGRRSCGQELHRNLKSSPGGKQVFFEVCTPFDGLQSFTLSKKHDNFYRTLKSRKAGELLPVEVKTVTSESDFDVFEEARQTFEKEQASLK